MIVVDLGDYLKLTQTRQFKQQTGTVVSDKFRPLTTAPIKYNYIKIKFKLAKSVKF